MKSTALAAVLRFEQEREVEAVASDGRVTALVPGEVKSTITVVARGRALALEVPAQVIDFLTAE